MQSRITPRAPVWFILRNGIVPWGIVAGLLAAVGGGIALGTSSMTEVPPSMVTRLAVAALCFVIWGSIVGWVVGAIRWELRRSDDSPSQSARR